MLAWTHFTAIIICLGKCLASVQWHSVRCLGNPKYILVSVLLKNELTFSLNLLFTFETSFAVPHVLLTHGLCLCKLIHAVIPQRKRGWRMCAGLLAHSWKLPGSNHSSGCRHAFKLRMRSVYTICCHLMRTCMSQVVTGKNYIKFKYNLVWYAVIAQVCVCLLAMNNFRRETTNPSHKYHLLLVNESWSGLRVLQL